MIPPETQLAIDSIYLFSLSSLHTVFFRIIIVDNCKTFVAGKFTKHLCRVISRNGRGCRRVKNLSICKGYQPNQRGGICRAYEKSCCQQYSSCFDYSGCRLLFQLFGPDQERRKTIPYSATCGHLLELPLSTSSPVNI